MDTSHAQSSAAQWLAHYESGPVQPIDILTGFCERLKAEGLPLSRVVVSLVALHPQVYARTLRWEADGPPEILDVGLDTVRAERYLKSPIYVVRNGEDRLRRRLEGPEPTLDYPILGEMRDQGVTDYYATVLRFSDGGRNFAAWSTERPGGFSDLEIARIDALAPLLAMRFEIESQRETMRTLLGLYLGEDSGRRVMAGEIRRAEGVVITAAIMMADLRGFTRLTDRLPMDQVIGALDLYYEAVAGAVAEQGGEILKLIGDGALAIFPIEAASDLQAGGAPCRAAAAALEGRARLRAIDPDDLPEGLDALRAGFALHIGEVMYGNVGSSDRLDFTAIGPAVNESARLEALCRPLERDVLASEEFARAGCFANLESLGFHALRGVREPKEIFAVTPRELPEPLRRAGEARAAAARARIRAAL